MGPRTRAPMSKRAVLLLLVIVGGIAFPLGAVASHQFLDVPDSHTFHANIDALADAAITTGCGGGNYCPSTTVDRGQMAGFLHRGLGRAASTLDQGSALGDGDHVIASLEIKAGGASGGTGYIVAEASGVLFTSSAGVCPCTLAVRPKIGDVEPLLYSFTTVPDVASSYLGGSYRLGNASMQWTFEVPTGTTQTVQLVAVVDTTSGTVTVNGLLTAVYVPFGSNVPVTVGGGMSPGGAPGLGAPSE